MEWTNMIDVLYDCGSKTEITVYWPNKVIIKGFSEGINETCDCTTEEDNCFEYYMCVMRITDIVQLPDDKFFNEKIGDLIELSVLNEPIKIEAQGKGVIWEK